MAQGEGVVVMFRKRSPEPPRDESGLQPRLAPRSPGETIRPVAAPPPPPRMRRGRGGLIAAISGALTLVVVLAVGALYGVSMLQKQVGVPGPLPADKVVTIPARADTGEIAALLVQEGVIDQPFLFEVYAFLNRQKGLLKAGEFQFKANASIDDAVTTLIEGRAILHSITIPEGLTSEQIAARLTESDVLSGEVGEIPREGTISPDTYRVQRGMSRQQLLGRMQRDQNQVLAQVWQRRSADLPVKTPQELLILASIVEKETGRADERSRVAGVFINRLGRRMRLQSDPTIVYGLVGGKGTLGRGIQRSEIDKQTPYNTYQIDGLPPGPIANPGRAALEAVANPSRTKELYFVADGTGGHAFAETYDQHVKNVARWRQAEKSRAAEEAMVDRSEPAVPEATTQPASVVAPGRPGAPAARPAGRPRAVDASEGTSRDPLLNRTYDLNSQKTVPPVRP